MQMSIISRYSRNITWPYLVTPLFLLDTYSEAFCYKETYNYLALEDSTSLHPLSAYETYIK